MELEGRVWKFEDHVDTDLIIPARFLNVSDEKVMAENCFVDFRPDFARDAKPGDIIVAGANFGCGSSREHAPLAIKSTGVGVIIAKSFARIFYRNAFNIGLPILEAEEAADALSENDAVSASAKKKLVAFSAELGEIRKHILVTKVGDVRGEQQMREKVAELYGSVASYRGKPTQSQIDRLIDLKAETVDMEKKVDAILDKYLEQLNRQVEKAGLEQIKITSYEDWDAETSEE